MALSLLYIMNLSCGNKTRNDDGEITLQFWQFWTDPEAKKVMTDLVSEFEITNPRVKIVVTDLTWGEGHSKIVVAFSGGNTPDILELGSDWVPEFSSRGALMDLTDYLDTLLQERIMWEPGEFDGSYYAAPWFLDTRAIFYNKALLRQAGYEAGSNFNTWDDFALACKRIDALGGDLAGFGINSYEKHRLYKKFLPFIWTNNGDVLDNSLSPVFDSKSVLEAFELYLKLADYGIIDNQQNLDIKFIDGTLGFNFSGGWLLKNIQRNRPDLEFGVMPVPSPDGKMGISFAGGEYLVISNKCPHPDAAVKFVKFLIDPSNTIRLCKAVGFGFPSTNALPDDPFYSENPYRVVFHQQLLNSRTPPNHPKWVYIEEVIEKTVEKGIYKKGDAETLLRQANDEIKQILDRKNN